MPVSRQNKSRDDKTRCRIVSILERISSSKISELRSPAASDATLLVGKVNLVAGSICRESESSPERYSYGHPQENHYPPHRGCRRCDNLSGLALIGSSQPRSLPAPNYFLSRGKNREADRDRTYRSKLDSSVNPHRQLWLSKSQAISFRLFS